MKSLFSIVALLLTSCAEVKIADGEWCADRGKTGATCFHTLSDKKRRVTKEEWDKERFGQVCAKPKVFADGKASIETFCQNTSWCKYEVIEKVQKFDAKVKASSK